MNYKEIFDTVINALGSRRIIIMGTISIKSESEGVFTTSSFIKDEEDYSWYDKFAGYIFSDDLIEKAFMEEFQHNVDKEGIYYIKAILSYTEEQRGNYPPPNLEAEEYMLIEHIEYEYLCTEYEYNNSPKVYEDDNL